MLFSLSQFIIKNVFSRMCFFNKFMLFNIFHIANRNHQYFFVQHDELSKNSADIHIRSEKPLYSLHHTQHECSENFNYWIAKITYAEKLT